MKREAPTREWAADRWAARSHQRVEDRAVESAEERRQKFRAQHYIRNHLVQCSRLVQCSPLFLCTTLVPLTDLHNLCSSQLW